MKHRNELFLNYLVEYSAGEQEYNFIPITLKACIYILSYVICMSQWWPLGALLVWHSTLPGGGESPRATAAVFTRWIQPRCPPTVSFNTNFRPEILNAKQILPCEGMLMGGQNHISFSRTVCDEYLYLMIIINNKRLNRKDYCVWPRDFRFKSILFLIETHVYTLSHYNPERLFFPILTTQLPDFCLVVSVYCKFILI